MNNPGFSSVASAASIMERRKYIEAVTVPAALQVAKTLFYGNSAFDPRILGLSAIAILYGKIPSLGISRIPIVTSWLAEVVKGEIRLNADVTGYAFGQRDAARASDLMIASFILYPLIVNQAPLSAILSLEYLTNTQNLIMGLSGVVLAALGVVVADYVMKATDKTSGPADPIAPGQMGPINPPSNVMY